jgi:cyclopropane-fatty-acyl-phospholipid synthase
MMNLKYKIENVFANAGIKILEENDIREKPWDIKVKDKRFYKKIAFGGSVGLGEAYMDNWWDCTELDNFFYNLLKARLHNKFKYASVLFELKSRLLNLQSVKRAFNVARHHYDIGNDLYECMLDSRMVYSCAYWRNANNLEEAQEAKLDLICQKLELKHGMSVLDIGCGWGSFAKYAAEKYNVKVTGITVSKEQAQYAQNLCKDYDDVNFNLTDYRNLANVGKLYDRIVSVGMFEHVGIKNYRQYMQTVNSCLVPGGKFLLHTIGNNVSTSAGEAFIDKYIFPNGVIPSVQQVGKSIEGLFILENWHIDNGLDYEKTLMCWYENFEKNWQKLKSSNPKYDDRFYRLWKYYLLSCVGSFRAKNLQVWQVLLSKR